MAILDRQWLARTRLLAGSGPPHGRPAARGRTRTSGVPSAGPVVLVILPAQVDESNAAAIRTALMAAAEDRPRVLIADMSGTRWCDWAGAGALASILGRAASRGTELRLVVTDESVRRVISLNGLDQLLTVFADVTTAVAAQPDR
jgi:anti-anti-sigma factor